MFKQWWFFCSLLFVVSCTQSTPKNYLRPDLVITYKDKSAELANAPVISEAVYGLLSNINSEILVVGVSSNSHEYDARLAAARVENLTTALNSAGIPDYKIHRMTRWGRGDNQIEIYGLRHGWRSMPTDMMNFAFASDLPKRQLAVVEAVNRLDAPTKIKTIDSLLVREGDFNQSLREMVLAAGWVDLKVHHKRSINLINAFEIKLRGAVYPLSEKAMQQVLENVLKETGITGIEYRLHKYDQIVVLTDEVMSE
ncbi:hypothetical protein M2404_003878 [Rheinheimera pacifica]|uniref:hypothetical protein n=1 Tax=Rheinheimera pacifica TaxID=173990 RepID=UPI0021674A37|nr:hypothetical protein [Rheinheimera pacifica]MCS4309506.1 hypothetical protein [Rheinheimera pacifica]